MDPYPLTDMVPDWVEALIVVVCVVLPFCVIIFGYKKGEF